MQNQRFLAKTYGALRSYLLLIVSVALMFCQLAFISKVFNIDSILNPISYILITFVTEPSTVAFIIATGFCACCAIWYSYRPVASGYVFLKNKMNRTVIDSTHFNNQYLWIERSASKISRKLKISTPKIVIEQSRSINAKVLPGFIHPSLIILSKGLLDKLTPDEIEAVIAHELAHVAMQDTYSMSVTDLLISLTVWMPVYILHLIIDYVILYKWRDKNIGFIFSLLLVLLGYSLFSLFFLNAISRRYELRADRIAIQSTNIQSFLSALKAVYKSQPVLHNPLEWCLTPMPKALQVFVRRTFLSHPSIPSRIQALQ